MSRPYRILSTGPCGDGTRGSGAPDWRAPGRRARLLRGGVPKSGNWIVPRLNDKTTFGSGTCPGRRTGCTTQGFSGSGYGSSASGDREASNLTRSGPRPTRTLGIDCLRFDDPGSETGESDARRFGDTRYRSSVPPTRLGGTGPSKSGTGAGTFEGGGFGARRLATSGTRNRGIDSPPRIVGTRPKGTCGPGPLKLAPSATGKPRAGARGESLPK